MESKNSKDLDSELEKLTSLRITNPKRIYFVNEDGEKIDLNILSPGTKANHLMEYIVFKNSSIPLVMDQPEDNIDNSTIYEKLTTWFAKLKKKRQVIVATHDPNIVVNADSENIIFTRQAEVGKFMYTFGALEYGDNISNVAKTLDGGSLAIERRLIKYGR